MKSADIAVVENATARSMTRADSDAALVDRWLFGKAENTRRKYRRDYEQFRALTGRTLREIAVDDVQAYIEAVSASGASQATIAGAVAAVKSLLTFAHRVGYTPFNVGAAVSIPKVPDTLTERIMRESETLAMLHLEKKPRNRAILATLYYGGLRVSELCGLRWKHVKRNDETGAGALTVHGKGGKTRHVAVPAIAMEALAALRGDDTGDDSPVFLSQKGGHLDQSAVNRIVAKAAERAGIAGKVSPHWLRHANASHALDNGAPISVVRDTLGHSSLATTSRYVHANPSDGAGMYLKA